MNPSQNKEKVCRIVVQQCVSAKLQFDTKDPSVSIGAGMIVFTCFLQGASYQHLDHIVKSLVNVKLCEDPSGASSENSRESVLQRNLDILIIPQATLGGKLKGKGVQYHGLVSKSSGEELFRKFVEKVRESYEDVVGAGEVMKKEAGCGQRCRGVVCSGVYGARQILSMDTNGPFTHIFEF